jgi:hypothetical protein
MSLLSENSCFEVTFDYIKHLCPMQGLFLKVISEKSMNRPYRVCAGKKAAPLTQGGHLARPGLLKDWLR